MLPRLMCCTYGEWSASSGESLRDGLLRAVLSRLTILSSQLRCNVIQDPFQSCSRCDKVGLICRIDSTFKRVGKRKRNAEMESDLEKLRDLVQQQQRQLEQVRDSSVTGIDESSAGVIDTGPGADGSVASISNGNVVGVSSSLPMVVQQVPASSLNGMSNGSFPVAGFATQPMVQMRSNLDQYMGSQEAVASLLDLKSGADGGPFARNGHTSMPSSRILEDVMLGPDNITDLFNE